MDHNAYNELKGMVKEAMYAELTKEAMSVAGAKKIATEAAHKAVNMMKSTGGSMKGFFKADDVHASQAAKVRANAEGSRDAFGEYHPSRALNMQSPEKAQLHARVKRALLAGGGTAGVGGAGYAGYESAN